MRPFVVCLPSDVRYWTVLDDDLVAVSAADAFLRHLRLGRDCSELTTRSYAGGIALFLRWCTSTDKHWHTGVEQLGLFITWLRHAAAGEAGVDAAREAAMAVVLAGPGRRQVRGASSGQRGAYRGSRVRGACGHQRQRAGHPVVADL